MAYVKNKKGFTLIELLIVITIIILLAGFSLAYYNNFTAEKTLDEEAKRLTNNLDLARKKASSADVVSQATCSSFNFAGYRARIDEDGYAISILCPNALTPTIDYDFQNHISVVSGSNMTIDFLPLTAGIKVNGNLVAIDTTITLSNSLVNKCINIIVSPRGTIEQLKVSCP